MLAVEATGIVPTTTSTPANTAATTMSPCANAITPVSRCTRLKPSAISPYVAPAASPVISAWSATGPLTNPLRDRVPDAQLALAEVDHLDVDGVLAGQVRLGLGAFLLVLAEQLVAVLDQDVGRVVALGGQLIRLTVGDR